MSQTIGYTLSDLSRMLRKRFDVAAKSMGVTGPQWRVLFAVQRKPGINQGQLADLLEVEPITTCRMVDRLEAAGLLERRRDPGDRRAWQLFVSDAAQPQMDGLHAIAENLGDVVTSGLTKEENAQLITLLGKLRDTVMDDTVFETKEMNLG